MTCELVAHLRTVDPSGGTVAGTEHLPDSCAVIESMGPRCRLAMSRGKDSLAAWVHLLSHGVDVDPVWMMGVPGMRFEALDIERLQQWSGRRITKLIHPSLPRMLRDGLFQPPARAALLGASGIVPPTFAELWELLDRERGERPVAHGVRAADSQIRRLQVIRQGPVTKTGHGAVWDWRATWWREALRVAELALPIDYQWFGRSFDGVDARFTRPLREHAPGDWEILLEWFPLAWLALEPREEARHASAA